MDEYANIALHGTGFWESAFHASSFWTTTVAAASVSLTATLGLIVWSARLAIGIRWRHLHRDRGGAANAVDMVLTMPIFLVVSLIAVQTGLFANNTLLVHYAAFAAARSARVHDCEVQELPELVKAGLASGISGVAQDVFNHMCTDDAQQWETAARVALIAAAPSSSIPCQSSCNPPDGLLPTLADVSGHPEYLTALTNKGRYAFDTANVQVSICELSCSLVNTVQTVMAGTNALPVRATVTYRMPVLGPLGKIVGAMGLAQNRGDGLYVIATSAQMWVL